MLDARLPAVVLQEKQLLQHPKSKPTGKNLAQLSEEILWLSRHVLPMAGMTMMSAVRTLHQFRNILKY
jgi:hypothetical protein